MWLWPFVSSFFSCSMFLKFTHVVACICIFFLLLINGLEEAQAGIKIAGRNINNLRYAGNTTLMAESEEELKNLLMKLKEESEKAGLIPSVSLLLGSLLYLLKRQLLYVGK